jgi:hypothetical protein
LSILARTLYNAQCTGKELTGDSKGNTASRHSSCAGRMSQAVSAAISLYKNINVIMTMHMKVISLEANDKSP